MTDANDKEIDRLVKGILESSGDLRERKFRVQVDKLATGSPQEKYIAINTIHWTFQELGLYSNPVLADKIMPLIIEFYACEGDPPPGYTARRVISGFGSLAIPHLLSGLKNRNPSVARRSLQALRQLPLTASIAEEAIMHLSDTIDLELPKTSAYGDLIWEFLDFLRDHVNQSDFALPLLQALASATDNSAFGKWKCGVIAREVLEKRRRALDEI